jgi:hypothetical protein
VWSDNIRTESHSGDMPTMTLYRNGVSASVAGGNPSPKKRGEVKGWTPGAVRRHTAWLRSVNAPANAEGAIGYAITLTMRDTPASSDDFHRVREALLQRIRRSGALRWHWVIEWQARGTPHIHMAIYWSEDHPSARYGFALTIAAWEAVAEPYTVSKGAQYWDHIYGPEGWLKYLSKHAARGVQHYQRNGKPQGWEKTGRLWGYGGPWEMDEPMVLDADYAAYWRLRRLVRSWRIADARAERDLEKRRARIPYARRMLKSSDRKVSSGRGVSDWVPEHVTAAFVAMLVDEGHDVTQR